MREEKGKNFFLVCMDFWDQYETLFDNDVPLDELRKDIDSSRMKAFIYGIFSLLESTSDVVKRRFLMRNFISKIMVSYSYLVDDDTLIVDCIDIISHFSSPLVVAFWAWLQDSRMEIRSSIQSIELRESVMRPILFKLLCFYAGLAVSDRAGTEKCKNLAEKLSVNWQKTTPESVTLSYLENREKNSKLPINECDLLEKYSFWNKMEP